MGGDKQYLKGILMTFVGVLVLSSDALLIRASGAEGFQAAFWRSLFTFLSLFMLFVSTRRRTWFTILKRGGGKLLFSSLLWAASGISFALGVRNSSAAVALVMISLAPFFASAHSYLFYRTKPHPLTLLAALGAIGGGHLHVPLPVGEHRSERLPLYCLDPALSRDESLLPQAVP